MEEFHEAWRACRAHLLTLLHNYVLGSLGPVLTAFQSAISKQPGTEDLKIQHDVPYQQMHSSLNAYVGAHKDKNDLLGTTIIWLALQATVRNTTAPSAAAAAAAAATTTTLELEGSSPSAAFIMYDLGCAFQVNHLTHVWVRSDRYYHGTIRDFNVCDGNDFLFGTALVNNREVTCQALKVLNEGGLITWMRRYDTEEEANTFVRRQRSKR